MEDVGTQWGQVLGSQARRPDPTPMKKAECCDMHLQPRCWGWERDRRNPGAYLLTDLAQMVNPKYSKRDLPLNI